MPYTTDQFIAAVERQSFAPANQNTFSIEDILAIGDETIKRHIIPAIFKVRQEYYVTYEDRAIVSGQDLYHQPYRAIGSMLRSAQLIDDAGNVRDLNRISLDHLYKYTAATAIPTAFYFLGDDIVLYPKPSGGNYTLRLYYSLRPGQLVQVADAGKISAIDRVTNIVTVVSIPSTWVTGNSFDFVSSKGSQRYLGIDQMSTLVSGQTVTLPNIPSELVVGDYITISGTSPLVQIPPEFQPALATLTAGEILSPQNQPASEQLLAKGMADLITAQQLITNRDVGNDEIILPDWS